MEPSEALRHSISHFAFSPSQTSTPLRRSSCRRNPVKDEVICHSLEDLEPAIRVGKSPKRNYDLKEALDSIESSPKKKRRILKRGYADPEIYAHLNALSDHLAPCLDVVFCGINPGCMSATKGHHFANPTNHFWKGLHLSGFTPRLLSPSEDATIPIYYSLGLTNLVERPSAEAAELSKEEMKQSVPSLMAKIALHRPLIVCFVGKGIWLVVEGVFKKQAHEARPSVRNNNRAIHIDERDSGGEFLPVSPSTREIAPSNRNVTNKPKATPNLFEWGLQPYKLVYSDSHATFKKEEPDDAACLTPASLVNETLFFVMPSTSGRVVSHQLADKVRLFSRLRDHLGRVKSKTLDTSGLTIVPSMS